MAKINIQPMGTRVLIKPLEQESKTSSGLLLPETAKEKPQTGLVLAIGDDEEIKLKVNDKVLFAKYSGTEFKMDGTEYLLLELETKIFFDLDAVEADHDSSTNVDNRYTLLARAAHHVTSCSWIAADIYVLKLDAFLAKILFCHIAKRTSRCAENSYSRLRFGFCHCYPC